MANIFQIPDLNTLFNQLNNYEDGDVFEVTADIDVNIKLVFTRNCEIRLNNHSLNLNTTECFFIRKSQVHVTNGVVNVNATAPIVILGTVDYPSKLIFSNTVSLNSEYSIAKVQKQSNLTLKGTRVQLDGCELSFDVSGKNATLDIFSSNIYHKGSGSIALAYSGGRLVISGDTNVQSVGRPYIEDDEAFRSCPLFLVEGYGSCGIITGSPQIYSDFAECLSISSGAQVSIENGDISSNSPYTTISLLGACSKLNIIGGLLENRSLRGSIIYVGNIDCCSNPKYCYIDIVGGIFRSTGPLVHDRTTPSSLVINLSGGRFFTYVDPRFLPPGKTIVDGMIVDDSSIRPEPEPVPIAKQSGIFYKSVLTYSTPSLKHIRGEWHGAYTIISETPVVDTSNGQQFIEIRIRNLTLGSYVNCFVKIEDIRR